jgi:hypothetical protein
METMHAAFTPTNVNDLEEIADLAYHRWEDEGRPAGRNLEIWSWAEVHFMAGHAPSTPPRHTATFRRAFPLISLLAALLLAGCVKPAPPVTFASAENFTKLLLEQLGQSGAVEEFGDAGGQVGNAHTRAFSRLLPAESFPPDRLFDAAKAAMNKWGAFDTFSKRGTGGGGNRFTMHFGTGGPHAFINVVAYPERDKTRVDFFIGVVE